MHQLRHPNRLPNMRPSLPAFIRILPKSSIKAQPSIVPPPLTRRDEAPARITLIETLLQRKTVGLAKEESGEVSKGQGWPVNLRVEKPVTRRMLRNVDDDARQGLKDIIRET